MPTPFPKTRVLHAYRLAFVVLGSYAWAWLRAALHLRPLSDDAWLALHQKNARRIVSTFNRLRGIYIKLGQSLSIMSNFLPEAFTQGLESLQDNVEPTPISDIRAVIQSTFNKSADELFHTFNPTPIASASLGQVHEAVLMTGERVAVKIQHPYVETLVRKDLRTLKRIFSLFHIAFPRYGINTIYRECAQMIRQELDFRQEGKHCEALTAVLREMPQCLLPNVFWEYTSQRILTTEFMDGVKVNRIDTLIANGIDRHEVATILLHSYCRQLFEAGLYHADPHPGNILVQAGPKVVFLDFGATIKISDPMRKGITKFVEGLIHKDTQMLTEALRQMGFVAKGDKAQASERIVEHFYAKISTLNLDNFKDIQSLQTLTHLIEPGNLDFSFRELATTFHIPREWVLLERTLLLILGLCSELDPTLNPSHIVLPYVETFVLGKDRHFNDLIVQMLKEAGSSYLTLGLKLDQALKKLDRGEIALNVTLSPHVERELHQGSRLLSATAIFCFTLFLFYKSHLEPALSHWQGPILWLLSASGMLALYYMFARKKS